MTIKGFIQTEILLLRLHQNGVLVVYDPERRYHELCLELATDTRQVVDASESSITSHATALAIAHDLEALYVEPPAGVKKGRGKKAVEVEDAGMFGEE